VWLFKQLLLFHWTKYITYLCYRQCNSDDTTFEVFLLVFVVWQSRPIVLVNKNAAIIQTTWSRRPEHERSAAYKEGLCNIQIVIKAIYFCTFFWNILWKIESGSWIVCHTLPRTFNLVPEICLCHLLLKYLPLPWFHGPVPGSLFRFCQYWEQNIRTLVLFSRT